MTGADHVAAWLASGFVLRFTGFMLTGIGVTGCCVVLLMRLARAAIRGA